MNATLSETISLLAAEDEGQVEKAAIRLGLLLERSRFRRRGEGTLGDVDDLLGDLAGVDLARSDEETTMLALRAHVAERDVRANPTVVWAIGKAMDGAAIDELADLVTRALENDHTVDLVYQALVTIAAVAPGSHEELFLRASMETDNAAADFARQQVALHGWS